MNKIISMFVVMMLSSNAAIAEEAMLVPNLSRFGTTVLSIRVWNSTGEYETRTLIEVDRLGYKILGAKTKIMLSEW